MMCTEQTGGHTNHPQGGRTALPLGCHGAAGLRGQTGLQPAGHSTDLRKTEQADCRDNLTLDNEQDSTCLGFLGQCVLPSFCPYFCKLDSY